MRHTFFKELLEKRRVSKKWVTVPLSFIVHGCLVAALIIVPYLDAESSLPDIEIFDVSIQSPQLPAIPLGKKGTPGKKGPNQKKRRQPKRNPLPGDRIVAPPVIPADIVEEDLFGSNLGVDDGTGVEGGIPNGIENGIDGGVPLMDMSQLNEMRTNIKPMRVKPPRLIKEVKPIYPSMALRARIHGKVIVEAVTDIYGRVARARVINGHPLLNNAAREAVKKWIYQPYIIGGIPKPVVFVVTVTFSLTTQ
jgi:protein TonB